jgi:ferredoxin-NADP reductase
MKSTQLWLDCQITELQDLSPTIRQFMLKPLDGHKPYWDAGAHVQVQVKVADSLQTRHYSLVGLPDGEHYRIAVKRMEDGRGGSMAMWDLAIKDRIAISGPHNHFALELGAPSYLLIAGGIGITPLIRMAQDLVAAKANVTMIYGVRSRTELAMHDALQKLLGDALRTAISDEGEQIDFEAEIAAMPPGAQLYTCGPIGMLEAVRQAWKKSGKRIADLRFETFGSSGRLASQSFQLCVPRHELQLTMSPQQTLLEALTAAGVQTISDCQRGECGLCVMDVISIDGEIDHRDVFLSPHEKQTNERICPCVSRAVGTLTLDSAWRTETVD